MAVGRILDDGRPIKSISSLLFVDNGEVWAAVGHGGVTKIVPYEENVQMSLTVWFAVYSEERIVRRLNAAHMAEIIYDG